MFLLSYKNTSLSLGQQEILWKHELQESVSTAFFSSLKLSREKVIADQNKARRVMTWDIQD